MNKLIIIGNGFDLAHGLPTSYEDFILWCLKISYKEFKHETTSYSVKDFIIIRKKKSTSYDRSRNMKIIDDYKKISDFVKDLEDCDLECYSKYEFINKIINDYSRKNWVDIETAYFEELKKIYKQSEKIEDIDEEALSSLNSSIDIIKNKLVVYLKSHNEITINDDILKTIDDILRDNDTPQQKVIALNFNYTNTIEKYINQDILANFEIINIHGNLYEHENQIIFGYGDETDEYFSKIENLNNNEFTRHLKSFSYLLSDNYRKLFTRLSQNSSFRIYIVGHSLGISDRLLLNNIFEHENTELIKIYYYEHEKGNDFFFKTQELSRHFKLNEKHKMRTRVIPFGMSKPLVPFKQKS